MKTRASSIPRNSTLCACRGSWASSPVAVRELHLGPGQGALQINGCVVCVAGIRPRKVVRARGAQFDHALRRYRRRASCGHLRGGRLRNGGAQERVRTNLHGKQCGIVQCALQVLIRMRELEPCAHDAREGADRRSRCGIRDQQRKYPFCELQAAVPPRSAPADGRSNHWRIVRGRCASSREPAAAPRRGRFLPIPTVRGTGQGPHRRSLRGRICGRAADPGRRGALWQAFNT